MRPRKYRAKAMPELTWVTADKNNSWVQKFNEPEWVYGYYAPTYLAEVYGETKNTYCIISDDTIGKQEMLGCGHHTGLPKAYHIIEDTVSQSIGVFDRNRKEIFEGDIVKGTISSAWGKEEIICEVRFENDGYYCIKKRQGYEYRHKLMFSKKLEVIGNLWDNPELLEDKYERDTI